MATKLLRRNGYVYGPGTKKGFERMRRLGIPGPSIKNENRLTKLLFKQYSKIMEHILRKFREAAIFSGLKFEGNFITRDASEDDTLKNLLDFFDEMGREAQEASQAAQIKSSILNASYILENETEEENFMDDAIFDQVEKVMEDGQLDLLEKLMDDAGDEIPAIYKSFSLDKRKVYEENIETLRRLYLDNSRERMLYEEDALKRRFLEKLNDYVEGRDEFLNVDEIVRGLQDDCARMARFFARDQMARFNKATTLMTFENAGVRKVKWVTCHDSRVRKTHQELDGKIFDIENLPPEKDDYNCRCGLIPVEYSE